MPAGLDRPGSVLRRSSTPALRDSGGRSERGRWRSRADWSRLLCCCSGRAGSPLLIKRRARSDARITRAKRLSSRSRQSSTLTRAMGSSFSRRRWQETGRGYGETNLSSCGDAAESAPTAARYRRDVRPGRRRHVALAAHTRGALPKGCSAGNLGLRISRSMLRSKGRSKRRKTTEPCRFHHQHRRCGRCDARTFPRPRATGWLGASPIAGIDVDAPARRRCGSPPARRILAVLGATAALTRLVRIELARVELGADRSRRC